MTLEPGKGKYSKYLPYAFTEHGILMLSNVLKSPKAIEVSMKIIDIFVQLREYLHDNTNLKLEIEQIKKKLTNHDKNIEQVFLYLDELIEKKEAHNQRNTIGYKLPNKE